VVLAGYPIVRAGMLAPLIASLGAVGMLFTLIAIWSRGRLAAMAVFSLAAEYVIVEATGRTSSTTVIPYGVGFIVLCELVLGSAELPSRAVADAEAVGERLLKLAATGLAAALLAMVALAATSLQLASAFVPGLIGAIAAVLLLTLPWLLLRR
jgi:hypothetical protein